MANKIFGPMTDKVTGRWKILHISSFMFEISTNVIMMNKSRRMKCASTHVVSMKESEMHVELDMET
jgi:hypothetical protein